MSNAKVRYRRRRRARRATVPPPPEEVERLCKNLLTLAKMLDASLRLGARMMSPIIPYFTVPIGPHPDRVRHSARPPELGGPKAVHKTREQGWGDARPGPVSHCVFLEAWYK